MPNNRQSGDHPDDIRNKLDRVHLWKDKKKTVNLHSVVTYISSRSTSTFGARVLVGLVPGIYTDNKIVVEVMALQRADA